LKITSISALHNVSITDTNNSVTLAQYSRLANNKAHHITCNVLNKDADMERGNLNFG
jgi:hypothetical protein